MEDRERILRYETFSAYVKSFPPGDVGKFLNSFSPEGILNLQRNSPGLTDLMKRGSDEYFQSLKRADIERDLQRLEADGVRRESVAFAMMIIKSAPAFDNKFARIGNKRERQQRAKRLITPLADLSDLAKLLQGLPGVILPGLVSQEIPNPLVVSSELRMLSSILDLGEFIYDALGANHLQEVSKFGLASLVHETTGRFLDLQVGSLIAAALEHQRYDATLYRVWRVNNYERLQKAVPVVTRFLVAVNTVVSAPKPPSLIT